MSDLSPPPHTETVCTGTLDLQAFKHTIRNAWNYATGKEVILKFQ